ncbi:hypothetical protein IE53DRAFT_383545 [Violaceomyces palustris]|uniref:Uncharacterized protein n=1 Tax=Violaceomyces palustris TaxID=1673888 RepID=A0ACD0P786_9BASI|nr:hypothetical protein IE53DRAFT_383545 [Violaceomyces palustris]
MFVGKPLLALFVSVIAVSASKDEWWCRNNHCLYCWSCPTVNANVTGSFGDNGKGVYYFRNGATGVVKPKEGPSLKFHFKGKKNWVKYVRGEEEPEKHTGGITAFFSSAPKYVVGSQGRTYAWTTEHGDDLHVDIIRYRPGSTGSAYGGEGSEAEGQKHHHKDQPSSQYGSGSSSDAEHGSAYGGQGSEGQHRHHHEDRPSSQYGSGSSSDAEHGSAYDGQGSEGQHRHHHGQGPSSSYGSGSGPSSGPEYGSGSGSGSGSSSDAQHGSTYGGQESKGQQRHHHEQEPSQTDGYGSGSSSGGQHQDEGHHKHQPPNEYTPSGPEGATKGSAYDGSK